MKTLRAELDLLTDREREVLLLMATGKNNAELAAELYVGEVQAVVFAYESGLM